MSDRTARFAGLYAVLATALMFLTAPLLSLSYFATSEGADELENGTVSGWAEPAADHLNGLLTWASADRVYSTYLQVFSICFPAVLLCALAIRRRRVVAKRSERWGWRVVLTGYGLGTMGIVLAGLVLVFSSPTSDALNVVFLSLMLPGMLISAIGSTWLGISLLRSPDRFTPRATAWLLAIAFPAMAVIPAILGHNSLGMLPMVLAWGVAGAGLWKGESRAATTSVAARVFEH
jgi:hypothetical protein